MKTWSSLLVGFWLSSLIALPTNAQISIDGTTNTQLTPIDNGVRIDEGDRAGGNLFHSFSEFSVLNGSEAFFNNANDIQNIFSRVTGGNISTIDGLLRANGTANLFLINPAGIILGQNARLDLGGSFLGSTADSILFEDGSEFIATDGQNQPILTINAPIGLSFRDNPAEITVEGTGNGARLVDSEVIDTQEALRVDADATIGLIGGKLRFEDATIKTAGGRIELGSVAGGQVNLRAVDNGWSFDYSAVENFSDISLSGMSNIDASGLGGGDIQVAGQNITLRDISAFEANTLGGEGGGDINILAAESLEISGVENELNFVSGIGSRVFPNGNADGGDITIETGNLRLGERAFIATSSFGQGNAGDITIKASNSLTLESQGNSSMIASSLVSGAIGNAANFSLTNDAILTTSSSGQGNAGNITVEVTDNFTASSSLITSNIGTPQGTPAAGQVGSIFITARNISFSDTAQIQAGAFSDGTVEQPGIISLTATESISFNGTNTGIFSNNDPGSFGDASDTQLSASNITLNDGAGIISGNESNGQGGNITLSTEQLTLNNGSRITAGVLGAGDAGSITIDTGKLTVRDGSQIGAGTNGQGNAGNLTISATELIELRGTIDTGISGLFANALIEDGNGGNLEIFTKDLIVSDGAIISVSNFPSVEGLVEPGTGEAGNLTIEANSLRLENRGRIDAATQAGNGGNIALQIADEITLRDNSLISARALKDANGGNITIDTQFIIASPNQNNDIIASAEQGIGGNINITAEGVFGLEERSSTPPNKTNDLDASSELGLDGSVSINTPDVGTFSETIEAPQIVQLQTLGIDACSSSRGLGVSSLEVTGQGGIPPQLTAPMGSESIFLEGKYTPMGKGQSERGQTEQIKPLVTAQGQIYPARGIVFLENGDIILTAYPTDNVQRIPHSSANCRKS